MIGGVSIRWPGAALLAMAMLGRPAAATEHLVEVARGEMGDYKADLQIPAGKFKELCVSLKKGERVEWAFASPVDTSFNIHYHVGASVSYPAKVDGIRAARGTLEVALDQDFCWLWKAGSQPAPVSASLKLLP
jgi:hypothetical protein